jgi:hypothetical protein
LRVLWAVVALVGLLVMSACGSGSSGSSHTVTSTVTETSTVTMSSSEGASTTTGSATQNLVVTAAVRAQLLAAGAALHQLPVSAYLGLRHGETYYAYDPSTDTYWAGAGLRASSSSLKAQVGDQDDGAYLDFRRPAGGSWHVSEAGIPGSTAYNCAVHIPASVLAVWGWAAGACHPSHE